LGSRKPKEVLGSSGNGEGYHGTRIEEVIVRIFKYPELLFIAFVLLAPVAVTFLWRSSTVGFLLRLLEGMSGGFAIWLAIIFLIVKPRYRNY
jgi:hypothetical protein